MNWKPVAAVALAIVAAFVALTVSVVDARRPLDGHVAQSFDRTAATLSGQRRVVTPRGCVRERLYLYSCSAAVRRRHQSPTQATWILFLHDDGCWVSIPPNPPSSTTAEELAAIRIGQIKGCAG